MSAEPREVACLDCHKLFEWRDEAAKIWLCTECQALRAKCASPEAEAHARDSDPDTSHAAAESVRRITETQEAIADLMRHIGRPMTDTEIAYRYGEWREHFGDAIPRSSPSGLRTRRSELVERKIVRDSGKRERLPSRRHAILWEIVKWLEGDETEAQQ